MNESNGFEDSIYTGAGMYGISDDDKNKLSQTGAIIIDSYESRSKSHGVSDFTINAEVANFFKKLADNCGSD